MKHSKYRKETRWQRPFFPTSLGIALFLLFAGCGLGEIGSTGVSDGSGPGQGGESPTELITSSPDAAGEGLHSQADASEFTGRSDQDTLADADPFQRDASDEPVRPDANTFPDANAFPDAERDERDTVEAIDSENRVASRDTASGSEDGSEDSGSPLPSLGCGPGVLEGSYTVQTVDDIAYLNTFSGITGDVILALDDTVTSVTLDCLETIGGEIALTQCCGISGNLFVTDLSLPVLQELGSLDLWITAISSLSLPALATVSGSISLQMSPELTSLELPLLTTVEQNFEVRETPLSAFEMPALTSIGGILWLEEVSGVSSPSLPALKEIGYLNLRSMPKLNSFSAPALEELGGLNLYENPSLPYLSLPGVTTVTAGVRVERNDSLCHLAIPDLTHVSSIMLSTNPSLVMLELTELETVEASFVLESAVSGPNQPLMGLTLPLLKSVGESLIVERQQNLKSIFLPALTSVGQDLAVTHNSTMTQVELGGLLTVGGHMEFRSNQKLETFSVPALEGVGMNLSVRDHGAKFTGFVLPSLATVDGDLHVDSNEGMTGYLLSHLMFVGGDVLFTWNLELAQCKIDHLVSQVEQHFGVAGEVVSGDNNDGCVCDEIGGVMHCP